MLEYYASHDPAAARRPKKILERRVSSAGVAAALAAESEDDDVPMGYEYKLLWRDVGYGGQDIIEWRSADYTKSFEGLIEDWQAAAPPSLFLFN